MERAAYEYHYQPLIDDTDLRTDHRADQGLGHGRIMGEMTTLHMGFLLHIAHPIGLQPASQTR